MRQNGSQLYQKKDLHDCMNIQTDLKPHKQEFAPSCCETTDRLAKYNIGSHGTANHQIVSSMSEFSSLAQEPAG